MGNWHCIPNGCGRVVYREYLPPSIRYRYEGEDWIYIDGDDYAIEQKFGQCGSSQYEVRGTYICKASFACNVKAEWKLDGGGFTQGKLSHFIKDRYGALALVSYYEHFTGIYEQVKRCISPGAGLSVVPTLEECTANSIRFGSSDLSTVEITYCRETSGKTDCNECLFQVFKNGEIVHEETRDVCPEVEKLPCRLSDEVKQVEVKKIPFLERLEVVSYAYDIRLGFLADAGDYGFLLVKGKIPDECLNIYKNNITSTIPFDFGNIANTPENNYQLIAQICSSPGCAPPEYQVICDCDCEECPDNTCPVECDGVICCYDDNGRSLKSIPVENYCGGLS